MSDREVLEKALTEADKAYYDLDDPIMPDKEYDKLCRQYEKLYGQKWERLGGVSNQLSRIPHGVPMLSLLKHTEVESMVKWMLPSSIYTLQPKIDGISGAIKYKRVGKGMYKIAEARTRGDGEVGESILHSIWGMVELDVIPALLDLTNYPEEVLTEELEIRGEFYIPEASFHQVGGKNPRNSCAGLLRRQDRDPKQKLLKFVAYRTIYFNHSDYTEDIDFLADHLGFEVPPTKTIRATDLAEMTPEDLHPDSWVGEGVLPYAIDGVVLAETSHDIREEQGETDHHPRWACAFKFEVEEAETVITSIDWNVIGITGAVTPVYNTEPVELCGTTVSRATGHNFEWYQRFGAGVGDRVVMVKRGEIIPQLARRIT